MSDKVFQFIVTALVVGAFLILASKLFSRVLMVIDARSVNDIKRIFSASDIGSGKVDINGYVWRTEVADDNWSRAQGLSGRENLIEGGGMLFIFDKSARHTFWMKGMNFPLDLIWINDGVVVDITSNAPPLSLSSQNILYKPKEPANMVLEINAGEAARRGVYVGSPVSVSFD